MTSINIKHLVLSGGGLLGISYIGLFKYFEEKDYIKNIQSITGCSAGAIFGSLLAIGYTYNELNNIVKSMIFKDYLKINVDSILNFTNTKGFESGTNLNLFIRNCIKNKTGNENITFSQIQEKYNIKLQIGVTNLTKNKFELLNNITSPELPIHTAISASVAIPFIFEPIVINNDIYCDGGVLDNLPIDTVINMYNIIDTNEDKEEKDKEEKDKEEKDKEEKDKEEKDKEEKDKEEKDKEEKVKEDNELSIIGFYLINKSEIINKDNYKSIGISQYFSLLTRTLSQCIIDKKKEKTDINKNKYKIITISIPCDIMTFIKLDATHDDINNIIDIAYNISSDELKLSN
jgi:predicted acylesterase/phospholipase RssA